MFQAAYCRYSIGSLKICKSARWGMGEFQAALGGATRGLFSRQHLIGEFQISLRAFGFGIVCQRGQAVAGGFG